MADKIFPVPSIAPVEPLKAIPGVGDTDPHHYQLHSVSLISLFRNVLIQEDKKRKKFSIYQKKILKKKGNQILKIESFVQNKLEENKQLY